MVDIRMKRQELLQRDEPPHIGVRSTRRRFHQCRRTQRRTSNFSIFSSAMSELPHVTAQVLPFSTGAHAAAVGSFVVLRGPSPELDVVYVDILGGGLFMEKPQELGRYRLAFEYLSAQALDLESSAARRPHKQGVLMPGPLAPHWFKSSYSGGSGTECIECATADGSTLVRDSATSPMLRSLPYVARPGRRSTACAGLLEAPGQRLLAGRPKGRTGGSGAGFLRAVLCRKSWVLGKRLSPSAHAGLV